MSLLLLDLFDNCKSSAAGSGSDNRSVNLVRVQKKELEELVSGCWETVAGEELPQHFFDNGQFNPHRNISERSLSWHDGLNGARVNPNSSVININDTSGSAGNNLESNYITSGPRALSATGGAHGPTIGQGILSSLISQIIAGEKPSEVCVEGMPVNTIRKLVCRQMSMATQLLIQILLQADERSDCFTKGYTSLMELSNMREKALKKAALIQMSVNNATAIKQFSEDNGTKKGRLAEQDNSNTFMNRNGNNGSGSSSSSINPGINNMDRRLTRSEFTRSVLSDKTIRCHSVFDIPALFQISNLFNLIDKSRSSIKSAATTNGAKFTHNQFITDDDKDILKNLMLDDCQSQTGLIMNDLNMRLWGCLIPQRSYPIADLSILSLDPASLSGNIRVHTNTLFSPPLGYMH